MEMAAAELAPSRKAATAVAAAGESTRVAARMIAPDGGRCRAASQHQDEERGDEEDREPTTPMSGRTGHAHYRKGNCRAGRSGRREAQKGHAHRALGFESRS